MRRAVLLLFVFICLSALASAATETVGDMTVELSLLPSETPTAGKMAILAFETTNTDYEITHIEGLLDIYTAQGTLLKEDFELHSHGDQYSMSYKFPEPGVYRLALTVLPAEDYNGPKFEPITVEFSLDVQESNEGSSNLVWIIAGGAAVLVLLVLVFGIIKKDKNENKI